MKLKMILAAVLLLWPLEGYVSSVPEYVSLSQVVSHSNYIIIASPTSPSKPKNSFKVIEVLYAEGGGDSKGKTIEIKGANEDLYQQIAKLQKEGKPTPIPYIPIYQPSISAEKFYASKEAILFLYKSGEGNQRFSAEESFESTHKKKEVIEQIAKLKMKTLVFGSDIQGKRLSDYDRAKAYHPPKSLKVSVDTPEVTEGRIHLRGFLHNTGSNLEPVIAFPVDDKYPFWAQLETSKAITYRNNKKAAVPSVPPPPMLIEVPGYSRVEFVYSIDLAELQYTGSPEAKLKWVFNLWNEPKPAGVVSFQLPQRK